KFGADEGEKKVWKFITEFMDLVGVVNVADFIPWLSMVNNFNGLNARVDKNYKDFDCFLESVIEEHIDPKKKTKNNGEKIEDFVDILLGMENDSANRVPLARDNIKAMILNPRSSAMSLLHRPSSLDSPVKKNAALIASTVPLQRRHLTLNCDHVMKFCAYCFQEHEKLGLGSLEVTSIKESFNHISFFFPVLSETRSFERQLVYLPEFVRMMGALIVVAFKHEKNI
ncbi:Cytochrome p450, partial [Thalictrum thalictroides]